MAYPAGGFESMIRNKITDVSTFFKKRHNQKFLIVNCSNRKYDYKYFDNQVFDDMYWPNHFPCPFLTFLKIIEVCLDYLLKDRENIISVHCLAGKGRTGSLISAILYTTNMYEDL